MLVWHIQDIKDFTKRLFLEEDFDRFELSKAQITTGQVYTIDGHLQLSYYETKEREAFEQASRAYSLWGDLRPLCFQLIRGKRTPLSFQLLFILSRDQLSLPVFAPLSEAYEQGFRFALNLHFTAEGLSCTTGIWTGSFSLDRTPGRLWDEAAESYLGAFGLTPEKEA